jgi:hypothetical protein
MENWILKSQIITNQIINLSNPIIKSEKQRYNILYLNIFNVNNILRIEYPKTI